MCFFKILLYDKSPNSVLKKDTVCLLKECRKELGIVRGEGRTRIPTENMLGIQSTECLWEVFFTR